MRNTGDAATTYARQVVNGEIAACQWVQLACKRHLQDWSRSDIYFDIDEANQRYRFFEQALILDNGNPYILPDWQKFIVGSIYGWKKSATETRKYQQALILVPRKNAKSTLVSGMALSSFYMDGVLSGQFYCIASDRGQASLLKDYGEGFVRRCKFLQDDLQIRTWEMRNAATHSRFKALHSDSSRLDGLNPYFVAFDEFHSQQGDDLDNVINSAFGSQAQYLYIKITTAGVYKATKPAVAQQDYGEKVLKGVIQRDSLFYINYTIDQDDDWNDPKSWAKANPNLGYSKRFEYMEDLCNEASDLPVRRNDFLTKQLNVWCESNVVWIPAETWSENGGEIDEELLVNATCYGGLDLGDTNDISALVWLFPPQGDLERWTVLGRYWVPGESIKTRADREKVPYDTWLEQGLINATDGAATDYKFIYNQILEDCKTFNVKELAYDRFKANEMVQALMNEGIDVVSFGQGFYSMGAPTAEIERLVLSKQLNHGGDPVLSWMASNAVVKLDPAGNKKIDKAKSTEKVDGMVALAMAVGRAILGDEGAEPEVFFV